jgi:hypothetical protein
MLVEPEIASLVGVPPSTKLTLNIINDKGQNVVITVLDSYEEIMRLISQGRVQMYPPPDTL